MDVAEGMAQQLILEVRRPGVMHQRPLEIRQNANRVGGLLPALGMGFVIGHLVRADGVQPAALPIDIETGLIGVRHCGLD